MLEKTFYAETFNAKGERGGSCNVSPESWSKWGRFVSVWGKVAKKLAEGDDSCLFEAIHAASYFKVYKTVGGDGDVVAWIIPNLLGNNIWEDADMLVVLYGCAKVEVFDVDVEVLGTFVVIRDGAIHVKISIEHAHGGRAGIARVV